MAVDFEGRAASIGPAKDLAEEDDDLPNALNGMRLVRFACLPTFPSLRMSMDALDMVDASERLSVEPFVFELNRPLRLLLVVVAVAVVGARPLYVLAPPNVDALDDEGSAALRMKTGPPPASDRDEEDVEVRRSCAN